MPNEQEKSPVTYTTWMGMPVFLNVNAGGIQTTLFCTIIGESDSTVRVRIGDQWDVDIYKEMIVVVSAFPDQGRMLARENPGGLPGRRDSVHSPAITNTSLEPQ